MNTALQELIEHFEDFKKHSPNVKLTLDEIINLLKDNLEKEKEQILDFTRRAVRKILDEDRSNPFNLEEYYNQTYNQNK